jgi:hypothetical protein
MVPSRGGSRLSLLPACPRAATVCAILRPLRPRHTWTGSASRLPASPPAAVREAQPLCPRGPWLRFGLCCPDPSSLTTTPSASLVGTQRFHGTAAYTSRLRCAGAPTRPTRPSLLSQPYFPHVPSTLRRWSADPSRCVRSAMPGFLLGIRSRHHEYPASASNTRRESDFGAASFASCYGPCVCLALLTGYDRVKSRDPHSAFSGRCHPRFCRSSSPKLGGDQARWANGKSPIVGTPTRPVTAASEAAHFDPDSDSDPESDQVHR